MKRAVPLIIFLIVIGGLIYWMYKNRSRYAIILEFFEFLKAKKLWWIMPIFVALLIISILIIFVESGALASAIYALF